MGSASIIADGRTARLATLQQLVAARRQRTAARAGDQQSLRPQVTHAHLCDEVSGQRLALAA